MRLPAVLSLLLALALAFVPLAPAVAMATAPSKHVIAHAGHDGHAMHGHEVTHRQAQADVQAPASDCTDHSECKGSCCAHCVSVPLQTMPTMLEAKPIQASHVARISLTFVTDSPSRPPQALL